MAFCEISIPGVFDFHNRNIAICIFNSSLCVHWILFNGAFKICWYRRGQGGSSLYVHSLLASLIHTEILWHRAGCQGLHSGGLGTSLQTSSHPGVLMCDLPVGCCHLGSRVLVGVPQPTTSLGGRLTRGPPTSH